MNLTPVEETHRKVHLAKVVEGYRERMKAQKTPPQILCTDPDMALRRYERVCKYLANMDIKEGATFLDVGCGFKWFREALGYLNPAFRYKSLDVIDDFTPDIVADFLDPDYTIPPAEWMVCLGTLNHDYGTAVDNYKLASLAIKKLYDAAIQGVLIDFMSEGHPTRHTTDLFYYNPGKIIGLLKFWGIGTFAILHDYSISEFMVVALK